VAALSGGGTVIPSRMEYSFKPPDPYYSALKPNNKE